MILILATSSLLLSLLLRLSGLLYIKAKIDVTVENGYTDGDSFFSKDQRKAINSATGILAAWAIFFVISLIIYQLLS